MLDQASGEMSSVTVLLSRKTAKQREVNSSYNQHKTRRAETIKAGRLKVKVKGRSVCVLSPNKQLDGVCESELFNTQFKMPKRCCCWPRK